MHGIAFPLPATKTSSGRASVDNNRQEWAVNLSYLEGWDPAAEGGHLWSGERD